MLVFSTVLRYINGAIRRQQLRRPYELQPLVRVLVHVYEEGTIPLLLLLPDCTHTCATI